MLPQMSDAELSLFKAVLAKSTRYLEFGCGGSTALASLQRKEWIIAVDSSGDWIKKVSDHCANSVTRPLLLHANIGPIGGWGYPTDPASQPLWVGYQQGVFRALPQSREADFVMVDGRFRVACFAQAILNCSPATLIAVHDFTSRPHYHVIHDLAREIAVAQDMSIFLPRPGARDRAAAIWETYRNTPD
jgi:hypothetical protein